MIYEDELITLSGKRALVVDDDEVICDFVRDVLVGEGFEVKVADGMQGALEAVRMRDFHIAIVDLKLKDGNGIELIRRIGELRPGLTCIVMTGYGTLESARAAMQERVYDFLIKPFTEEELRASVQSALRRSILAEENAAIRQLSGLFEASKAISALMDIERLPNLLLGAALAQTHAKRGIVAIREGDDENEGFKIASLVGWQRGAVGVSDAVFPPDSRFSDLIRGGEPVLVTRDANHPLSVMHSVKFEEPGSNLLPLPLDEGEEMMILPLKTHTKALGAIAVTKNGMTERFTHADLQILTVLARHSAVALENSLLLGSLEESYLSTFKSLAMLMEARDPMMLGHSQRVTEICDKIAVELGINRDDRMDLHYAASLHDIGKVAISERILKKTGPLSEEEWAEIRKHPETAYRILEPIAFLKRAREIILHHHERGDGSGYPFGLRFKDLSVLDNILIVADMFDAMNSDRAYRPRIPPQDIIAHLYDLKGTQVEGNVVEALGKLYQKGLIKAR